ncbi:catechol 2,3-dioxygenase [Gracilibacillus orientalis]|uniref:Catechol 2,3-dioxygenase n=1 Tax=Gracilibacillus orientalis TaxID=334253 RepID=A0A1I4N9I6_9BACI|nr:VOC family protein [Gracilibacillus orientalis]SFM12045.1 catechol 2,3-dioxygenase [Gracilibacillus orientalis]
MNFHRKPITFVSNVTIRVQDLARSIAFYQKVIGFDILEKTNTTAALTADGKTSILTLEQPENAVPKQGRTTGLYHFAILLPTRKDLANFVFHSMEVGLPLASSDHLVSEALYFSDLDGNGIEVYRDRDPAGWTWQGDQVNMAVDPLDFEDLLKEGEKDAWQGLPQETAMGHIHLYVAEIGNTKHFYEKGLGFETVCQFGDQALFISTGKYHHHIGLNTWNGVGAPAPSENSAGLQSYTISYPTKEAVHRTIQNLKAIGASVEEEEYQAITRDPSGNKIILTY